MEEDIRVIVKIMFCSQTISLFNAKVIFRNAVKREIFKATAEKSTYLRNMMWLYANEVN